jgi:uncharacterized protein
MKIAINQVPAEGLDLDEKIKSAQLDLDTELIKFGPLLEVRGKVTRITNALTVELNIQGSLGADCSRCLNRYDWKLDKNVRFTYPLESSDNFIDLDPDIREEIILDYPIKPLCRPDCQGLCLKCGKNKNEGGCNCGST